MKTLILPILILFSLTSCSTVGSMLQGMGNGLANTKYSQPNNQSSSVYCSSMVAGNQVNTLCN